MSAPVLTNSPDVAEVRQLSRAACMVIVCAVANLALPLQAEVSGLARTVVSATDPVRAVLARHDCCGRLANTEIVKVGVLRSGGQTLAVYDLWFVNPESRHGMRHLAIVEGDRFRGSYIISSWATPSVEGNRVRFTCASQPNGQCDGEDLVVENGALPPRLWVDGEVNVLGDTI